MRQPLDSIVVTGEFREKAQPGTGLKDVFGIGRHIGVDYRAVLKPVYAPGAGKVTASYLSPSGIQIVEMQIGAYLWRFLHLSKRNVKTGQNVAEGAVIATSGNSGGVPYHLHVDARKQGTAWNASLANYVDPRGLINAPTAPKPVSIKIKFGMWNVRTSPNGPVRGLAVGGQQYGATIDAQGWARIDFKGAPGYVGPAAYNRI